MTPDEEMQRKREAWLVLTAAIDVLNERIPKVEPKDKTDLETTVRTLSKLIRAIEKDILRKQLSELREALDEHREKLPHALAVAVEEIIPKLDHGLAAWQEDETSLTAETPIPH